MLLPDLQEISDFPYDVGSEVEELKARARDWDVPIDWSFVHEGWTSKRPEKEIVVVTHGAFLHFLTEDWEDSYAHEGTGWTNAEYRTYMLEPKGNSGAMSDASFFETVQSRRRRGKTDPVPVAEQVALYSRALQEWDDRIIY
ncbi:phosphoglycerate mutase-like protein [Aspergillus affinis]|uniref:phosphoglycerate mutase-like protein n=1 Tax=Aspergillus affinis TaxID=1070780 RepID=UPI0022FDC6B9|nr:phosphoglycerate mutase-like protein [Aspergillus affinis]KAI9045150.1 phosphoglycerate mutase-like protein [Aspergillus affinis]